MNIKVGNCGGESGWFYPGTFTYNQPNGILSLTNPQSVYNDGKAHTLGLMYQTKMQATDCTPELDINGSPGNCPQTNVCQYVNLYDPSLAQAYSNIETKVYCFRDSNNCAIFDEKCNNYIIPDYNGVKGCVNYLQREKDVVPIGNEQSAFAWSFTPVISN